jgi:hypothetical protein
MLGGESRVAPLPGASETEVRRLVADPQWLPHAYDARRDTLGFAYLPREAHRRAVFLDSRFISDAPKSPALPIASLPKGAVEEAAGPLHFIFHTSFCCSTLLTRAFDQPGVSMGLKEPTILLPFAKLWASARQRPGALRALEAVLNLLSRPMSPGETQIVKPSNATNHIIPHLLHGREDAKALVMTSSLETFLTAVVRRGAEGRMSMRQVLAGFADTIPLDPPMADDEVMLLTDLQAAALVWLMQTSFLHSVVTRFGDRVRVLDCDTMLADPGRALTALGGFFGLAATDWSAVANGPVFQEHAKNLGAPFDAAAYRRQRAEASALHRAEIAPAWRWAHNLATRFEAPLALSETLLG